MFGTACNYVALRILGLDPNHPVMEKARTRLHDMGKRVTNELDDRLTMMTALSRWRSTRTVMG